MARQDDHVRHTVRIPSDIYERIANLPGEGSINAKIVNTLATAGGKTLRDEFAMAALAGFMAQEDWGAATVNALNRFETAHAMKMANFAYQLADAMLAERLK